MNSSSENGGERRGAFDFARSVTQRRRLRKCNFSYYLHYGEGYTAKARKGTYAFGDAWQVAVEAVLQGAATSPEQMYEVFCSEWAKLETAPLEWNSRTGYTFFLERGKALAQVAYRELRQIVGQPKGAAIYNQRFTYELAPGVRETAVPDYVGPVLRYQAPGVYLEPVETVIDWKTSPREYQEIGVELDEQLTAYQLGVERHYNRRIEQVALCVFIYAAMPKVQWIFCPRRPPEVLEQFVASAVVDDQRIRRNEFPRNTNACFLMGRCEMVPICYPSQRHLIAAELDKPAERRNDQPLDWIQLEAIETE